MTGLQRDGDLRGQHRTADPIHDGGTRDEPFGHWDLGRIECPHLVGAVDGEPAQQIGIHFMPGVLLAGARLPVERLHPHARHPCPHVFTPDHNPLSIQLIAQHASPNHTECFERPFSPINDPANLAHYLFRNGGLIDLPRRAQTRTLSQFITQPSKGVRSFRLRPSSEAILRARASEAKKASQNVALHIFKMDSAPRTRML